MRGALLRQIRGSQPHFLPPLRRESLELLGRPVARDAAVFQINDAIRHVHQVKKPVFRDDVFPCALTSFRCSFSSLIAAISRLEDGSSSR